MENTRFIHNNEPTQLTIDMFELRGKTREQAIDYLKGAYSYKFIYDWNEKPDKDFTLNIYINDDGLVYMTTGR